MRCTFLALSVAALAASWALPVASLTAGHDETLLQPSVSHHQQLLSAEIDASPPEFSHAVTSSKESFSLDSDIHPEYTTGLLSLHRRLVEISSISSNESNIGEWLMWYLEAMGFAVEKQVPEGRTGFNVIAYPQGRKHQHEGILVTSHIDTVSCSLIHEQYFNALCSIQTGFASWPPTAIL